MADPLFERSPRELHLQHLLLMPSPLFTLELLLQLPVLLQLLRLLSVFLGSILLLELSAQILDLNPIAIQKCPATSITTMRIRLVPLGMTDDVVLRSAGKLESVQSLTGVRGGCCCARAC
jgi:hypothetical protein